MSTSRQQIWRGDQVKLKTAQESADNESDSKKKGSDLAW